MAVTEFETAAELSLSIPDSELRDARDQVEEALGSVTVSVDGGEASGGVASVADGGEDTLQTIVDVENEQLDILEDLLDEVQAGALGAGGGPGGLLGGAPGALSGLGGSGLASRAKGGLLTGALSFLATEGGGNLGEDGAPDQGPVDRAFNQAVEQAAGEAGLEEDASKIRTTLKQAVEAGTLSEGRAEQLAAEEGVSLSFDSGEFSEFTSMLGQQADALANAVTGIDIPEPDWIDRLQRDEFEAGDAVEGPSGATLQTTPGGEVVPSRGQETPNFVTTERGVSRRVDTRGQIIPDRGEARREASRSRRRDRQRTNVQVDVENRIESEVDLRSLSDLQRFLRDPERFVERALGFDAGFSGRGP